MSQDSDFITRSLQREWYRKCYFLVSNSTFFWLATHTKMPLEGEELSLIPCRLFLTLLPLSAFIYYFWLENKYEFVNFNKIFIAINILDAIIFILAKWHDTCVHFLVTNSRSGTGEMQPLSSTKTLVVSFSLGRASHRGFQCHPPIPTLSETSTNVQVPLSCLFWIPDQRVTVLS